MNIFIFLIVYTLREQMEYFSLSWETNVTMPPLRFSFETRSILVWCRHFPRSMRKFSLFLSHCCVVVTLLALSSKRAFPIFVAVETRTSRTRDTRFAEWLRFIDIFQGARYLVCSKFAQFYIGGDDKIVGPYLEYQCIIHFQDCAKSSRSCCRRVCEFFLSSYWGCTLTDFAYH